MRRSESEEKENRRMLVRALTGGRRGAGGKRQRVSPMFLRTQYELGPNFWQRLKGPSSEASKQILETNGSLFKGFRDLVE